MEKHKALEKLIIRIHKGEKDAFSDLYGTTYQKVYFYALKLVKNKESAEDVVQEVYEDALESLYELKNPRAFIAWINKKTYFHAMNYLRKENRHITLDKDAEIFLDFEDESPEISPEYSYLNNETKKTIMRELDKLSFAHRSVILLRYHQDLTLKQISEAMGCSLGTVKSRLSVAKNHLKNSINKKNYFIGIFLPRYIKKTLDEVSKNSAISVGTVAMGKSAAGSGGLIKFFTVAVGVIFLVASGIGAYIVNQENTSTSFYIDTITANPNSGFTNNSVYIEVKVTGSNIEKVYLISKEEKVYEGTLKEPGVYGVYVSENGTYDVAVKSGDEIKKKQLSIKEIDKKAPELLSVERKEGVLVISLEDDYSGIDWEKTIYVTEKEKIVNIKRYRTDENKVILEYTDGLAYLTLYDQAGNHIVYEIDKIVTLN